MRLPDFFIIGAAKAGTTSLHAILDRHPQVFMPEVKEPEFFARDDRYAEGIEAYAGKFAAARPDQVVGEASTIYSLAPLFPSTPERIHVHVPDARIVYVLREPVSRAYSYYLQLIKGYQNATRDYAVHRSFEEFVLPEAHARAAPACRVFSPANAHLPDVPELCLAGSDYVRQIEAYLEFFPRERMLFLKFEDFAADRAATLARLTGFLGVGPVEPSVLADEGSTRNVSQAHFERVGETRAVGRLGDRLGPLWGLRRLVPGGLKDGLRRKVAARAGDACDHVPPPMRAETRAALRARFAADRGRLAALTGLDFADWDRG